MERRVTANNWTPENVRALRKFLGMNQADFGVSLGFGKPSAAQVRVSQLERGRRPIRGQTLALLDYMQAHGPLFELRTPPRPEPRPRPRRRKRARRFKSRAKRGATRLIEELRYRLERAQAHARRRNLQLARRAQKVVLQNGEVRGK